MSISLILLTFALMAIVELLIAEHNLISIINSLNENLNIEWNLIITQPQIAQDIEHVMKNTNKSLLIVTEVMEDKAEMDLVKQDTPNRKFIYEMFSQNVLTIVNLENHGRDEVNEGQNSEEEKLISDFRKMATLTKVSLTKLHFTHILWVTKAASVDILYDFANICWDYGFTKVLFLTNDNSLYVYDKFPSLRVRKLSSLDHYNARKEITNFHQYPLRFPITATAPRCYRYTDRHGKRFYAGYMYRILAIFMQHFNFTFSQYPHDYSDDDREHLMRALDAGDMDFTAFFTYPNRSFDASDVMWNSNAYLLVPNAKPIPKYQYFRRPFANLLWLLNCLVVLLASLNIAGFLYVNQRGWDFSKSFLYVFSLLIYQHHSLISIGSWRFKLLYVMLIVYTFVMINYYLCMLSSMLVSTLYEPQINTIDDLKSTNLRLMFTQTDLDYYNELPRASPLIKQLISVASSTFLDELRRNLSTSYLQAAFEDKLRFYMYQQKYLKVPRLRLINEELFSVPIFFTVRQNLPYLPLFNHYLRNLWASGVLWKTFVNMEWSGILSGQISYFRDEENEERLLTMEYFYSPLAIYCGGVVLSVLAFSIEILYFKYNRKN